MFSNKVWINFKSKDLFVCFFVWGISSHSRIFHSYEDVTITGEGLQMFTYIRHIWLLSSEGSLACQTYCDMEHPFIMVERLAGELSLPVLTCQVCRGWDSNTQPSACGANAFTNYATAAAQSKEIWHLIRILMVTSRRVWDRLITHCCLTLQNAIPHCPLWENNRSPFDVTIKILLWRRIVPYFKINLSFFMKTHLFHAFRKVIDTHDRFDYF